MPATIWWRGKDSNLRRQSRQIYSLIPLAAREPLQECAILVLEHIIVNTLTNQHVNFDGAGERSRTPDRLITSQLLYLLSYASALSTQAANSTGIFYLVQTFHMKIRIN